MNIINLVTHHLNTLKCVFQLINSCLDAQQYNYYYTYKQPCVIDHHQCVVNA